MAKCSFANWRPLPENWTEPYINVNQFIFHTQVGYFGGLYSWFARKDVLVESHFGLSMGGYLEQYIDTARQADAQYRGNYSAISLECEDKGDPIKNPYTDAQMTMMVKLSNWAIQQHSLPRRRCRNWQDGGFGWHSMWGAPSHWTPVPGKTCPGYVRIEQLKNEVLPEIFLERAGSFMIPVAIVVSDVNGIDAGLGHALQSRISTLLGIEVPVMSATDAANRVAHAVIVGSTKSMNPKSKFESFTVYQGTDRVDSGKLVDRLLGGSPL